MAASIDTSAIDAAAKKVDALGRASPKVHVDVDDSPIDAAINKVLKLQRLARNIGALDFTGQALTPSLNSTVMGNFSLAESMANRPAISHT